MYMFNVVVSLLAVVPVVFSAPTELAALDKRAGAQWQVHIHIKTTPFFKMP